MNLQISVRVILLLIICTGFWANSAIILPPPHSENYSTVTLRFNAPWATRRNLSMTSWLSNDTMSGKIVLYADEKSGDVPIQPMIRLLQKRNPAVVVLRDNRELAGKLFYDTSGNDKGIYTPVIAISPDFFDTLVHLIASNGTVRNVTVTDEPNPWEEVLSSPWLILCVQVPFFVWAMVLAGLCVYKLVRLALDGKLRLSTVVFIACFELAAALLRGLQSVDIWGIRRIYHMYFVTVMNTADIPFALASFLITALRWQELLLEKQININAFLSKMRIPFVVAIIIALTAYVALQIATFVFGSGGLIPGIAISVYLLTFMCIGVFFNVTAIRVLLLLRSCPNNEYVNLIRRTMYRGVATGVVLILLVLYPILFLPIFFNTPGKWLSVLTSFVFFLWLASTLQVSSLFGRSGLAEGLQRDKDKDKASSNEGSVTTTSS